MTFDFEKPDVCQVALEFVVSADDVPQEQPRGRRCLKDKLLGIFAMQISLTKTVSGKYPCVR